MRAKLSKRVIDEADYQGPGRQLRLGHGDGGLRHPAHEVPGPPIPDGVVIWVETGGLEMTITLELTADQQDRLEDGTARHDRAAVRQILLQAVDATVDSLLDHPTEAQQTEEDFESLSQRLADQLAATAVAEHRPLGDEALTRAGIYGAHL